jgi:hypothetical protein
MSYSTFAHISDSVPCQVVWLGTDRKPLNIQNSKATLFKYVANVKTVISGPNDMVVTDQAHRLVYRFDVPENVLGQTIYVAFQAELVADNSLIYDEMSIYVSTRDTFINVV